MGIRYDNRSRRVNREELYELGDNYAKLAQQKYGDAKLWWVLAWYNQKPTDGLIKVGDTIRIPQPIDRVLQMFGV